MKKRVLRSLLFILFIVFLMFFLSVKGNQIKKIKSIYPYYDYSSFYWTTMTGRFPENLEALKNIIWISNLMGRYTMKTLPEFDERYPTNYAYEIDATHICKAYSFENNDLNFIQFRFFDYLEVNDCWNWYDTQRFFYLSTYPSEKEVEKLKIGDTLLKVESIFTCAEVDYKSGLVNGTMKDIYCLYEGGVCIISFNNNPLNEGKDNIKIMNIEKLKYDDIATSNNQNVIDIFKVKNFIESFIDSEKMYLIQ